MARVPGAVRFVRMAGSSIATPGAAGWVTDLLNAAYYARPAGDRDVADLRLAHGIIVTRWASLGGRRLAAADVVALNRSYGALRLRGGGRLNHDALLEGTASLIGDWFTQAWPDDRRRAHGIAFRTAADRDAFDPARRLRRAALGPLTPPRHPVTERQWSTYDPVSLPDPDAALALLTEPARWPDMASAAGRFTALRVGGLRGQTFEIEVVAAPAPRVPVFTRGYVTCTATHLHTEDPEALARAVGRLVEDYASATAGRRGVVPVLPEGGEPLALVILTTHEGHFLGPALSHLLVWRDAGGSWIRDVGAWDPLAPHLAAAYRTAGRRAQHEFWGPEPPERSMLAQLALVSAGGVSPAAG